VLGLIGKKIGMTQAFDETGNLVPLTVVEAGPCPIVQVKDVASDGYGALRVGFDEVSGNRLNRPQQGIYTKAGVTSHRVLREFRVDDPSAFSVGDVLDVGVFESGESVDVTGRSKGKGFQGTVKRHHFKGGPKTHGQSDRHRAPGSIGQSSYPGHVFKGMNMSGHMGNRQVTVQGLTVVKVDKARNLVLLKGAVPGGRGGVVVVRKRGNGK
jgi:large subunit ribosomal protein L3